MRFSILMLGLASAAIAAPTTLVGVQKHNGPVKEDSFIITLKPGVSKSHHVKSFNAEIANDEASTVVHDEWDNSFIHGYSATLSPAAQKYLRSHPDVQSIEEDGIMSTSATVTQTNAPWGIARLDQNAKLTSQNTGAVNFAYSYDSSAGSGVDIYIVDTGIYTQNADFGGRARWGATFGGYANADGNGHGTHCAGTASGTRYGVAKAASLIAVKVLSDQGSGAVSDIVSGLNWVIQQVKTSGRPSIVSMSLGGGVSTALDQAVAKLTQANIHVTVAAGNAGQDASNTSPARAPSANTIGATNIADQYASFSNYGPVVDLFAPGVDITSTWIGSTTATNKISGTSMSTPHVAGLIAYLIRLQGNMSPSAMSTQLKNLSVKNAISKLPADTINDLGRNNIK